jgi:hypothetical protein
MELDKLLDARPGTHRFLLRKRSKSTVNGQQIFNVFPVVDGKSCPIMQVGNLVTSLGTITLDDPVNGVTYLYETTLGYIKVFSMLTYPHGRLYKSFYFKFDPSGKVITIFGFPTKECTTELHPLFKAVGWMLTKDQALEIVKGTDDIGYLKKDQPWRIPLDTMKKIIHVESLPKQQKLLRYIRIGG